MNGLRNTLHAYADRAPSAVGLLDHVARRSRRLRRRRMTAIAGAAALVVAGGAATAPVVVGALTAPLATPGAQATGLVPASYALPPFPYRPGWTPPELGQPFAGFSTTGTWLRYPQTGPGEPPLMVSVESAKPAWVSGKEPTDPSFVDINGTQAELRELPTGYGNPGHSLLWAAGDRWIAVVATGQVSREDLLRFARELLPGEIAVRAPFILDLLPAIVGPALCQQDMMEFSTAGAPQSPYLGLSVTLLATQQHLAGATKLEVGGRPAELSGLGDKKELHVDLANGTMLQVIVVGTVMISDTDLVRLAAGIQVTPDAVPTTSAVAESQPAGTTGK